MSLPTVNLQHLMESEKKNLQDLKGQGHYSKVKSRSHHDVAHLQPRSNVPSQSKLPTSHSFRGMAWTKFLNSSSPQQGKMSNQGHTIILHTFSPNQCPYQVSIPYTLQFLRYSLDKLFPAAHLPIWIPWMKTLPAQLLKPVG